MQYKSFQNTVGKGEIVCYEQFLPFSHGVSYPFGDFLLVIFIEYKTIMNKLFQFGKV